MAPDSGNSSRLSVIEALFHAYDSQKLLKEKH